MSDIDDELEALRRAGLFRELRVIESAQGPRVTLDGRPRVSLERGYASGADPRLVRAELTLSGPGRAALEVCRAS